MQEVVATERVVMEVAMEEALMEKEKVKEALVVEYLVLFGKDGMIVFALILNLLSRC
jgi:hypothetical protein